MTLRIRRLLRIDCRRISYVVAVKTYLRTVTAPHSVSKANTRNVAESFDMDRRKHFSIRQDKRRNTTRFTLCEGMNSFSNGFCAFCFWVTFLMMCVVFFDVCVAIIVDIVRTELFSWILFFEHTSFWLRVLVSDKSFKSFQLKLMSDSSWPSLEIGFERLTIYETIRVRVDALFLWGTSFFLIIIIFLFFMISLWSEIKSRNDIAKIIVIQFTIIPKYYYHHFINLFWGYREPHPLQICILRTYCIFQGDFNVANQ